MKKRFGKLISFILAAAVLAGGLSVSAVSFDELDENSALAGASSAISRFIESNNDGAVILSDALEPMMSFSRDIASVAGSNAGSAGEAMTETVYSEPKTGTVSADAILNVRQAPTTLSDVVEFAVRGADVSVLGENIVNGKLWYQVQVNGAVGYVAGNFIVFGEEAEEIHQKVKEELREAKAMPDGFDIDPEWIQSLDPEVRKRIKEYRDEINYCLAYAYPQQKVENNYLGMYSIMIYLIENYTGLYELISEYGETYDLTQLSNVVQDDLLKIDANREFLSEDAGQSSDEMMENLVDITESERASEEEARRQAEEEENRRRAEEESRWAAEHPETPAPETQPETPAPETQPETPAPETQPEETPAPETQPEEPIDGKPQNPTGQAIAAFAESWVGRINYGWGCDDFREGGYVDCSHFTYHVFLQFGLVGGYTYSGGQCGWGKNVGRGNMQPGDLVCYPGHVAIYIGNGTIVHAPAPCRKIEYGDVNCLPIIAIRRLY